MGSTMSTVTTGVIWAALLAGTTGCSVKRFATAGRFPGQQRHHVCGRQRPGVTAGVAIQPEVDRRAPGRKRNKMLFAAASGFTPSPTPTCGRTPTSSRTRTSRSTALGRVRDDSICAGDYGLRGPDGQPGFSQELGREPQQAVGTRKEDAAALLDGGILGAGVSKNDPNHRRSADRRGADRSAGVGPRFRPVPSMASSSLTSRRARGEGDRRRARASISTGWSR
jgi:hypothetical protein